MTSKDFGSREIFFLLLLGIIAIGISWSTVWLFPNWVVMLKGIGSNVIFLFIGSLTQAPID